LLENNFYLFQKLLGERKHAVFLGKDINFRGGALGNIYSRPKHRPLYFSNDVKTIGKIGKNKERKYSLSVFNICSCKKEFLLWYFLTVN
jgi:hypothetical protein